jgi:hypothetical protein
MKFLYLLIFTCLASKALALEEFRGLKKGSQEECSLIIQQIHSEKPFQAEVMVVLKDDHHGAVAQNEEIYFQVGLSTTRTDVLSGFGTNQKDQINIFIRPGSQGLNEPHSFAVKWLHNNHFHATQCLNLRRVQN